MDPTGFYQQQAAELVAWHLRPPPTTAFAPSFPGVHDQQALQTHQNFPPHQTEPPEHADPPGRIAHTLTACCRCRQRKTRCDPTLPRCLPCERSNSQCEYFDTAKNKKINRSYVCHLQDRVRSLEGQLGQYTDELEFPSTTEDIIQPGSFVRLHESNETPRYLGPSSGVAMTRILLEEAKRYTDVQRISDLIPDAALTGHLGSSQPAPGLRSQSFAMPVQQRFARRKSFPMLSSCPAPSLPSDEITNGLMRLFSATDLVLQPVIHEGKLQEMLNDVRMGSKDPHSLFIVNMIMAISIQKLPDKKSWAGAADSYYLAAMEHFTGIVQLKDIKTLQCLILICRYSLLTPTRMAAYYVAGLAVRICQQLGLADEKNITVGANDPLTLDLRRRVFWIVTTLEHDLAHNMGRPVGFAKGHDFVDVELFETARDENITADGIMPGPVDENKLVAAHFCKMFVHLAEIRLTLYEKKHSVSKNVNDPWFMGMEKKLDDWLEQASQNPSWCKAWFSGRYHSMRIALHRPSPENPSPSVQSGLICFESACNLINIYKEQIMSQALDVTWIFLLNLFQSINCLLWSLTTFREVRAKHAQGDTEELINVALDILDQCDDKWPGTCMASRFYSAISGACLQSYHVTGSAHQFKPSVSTILTPPSQPDTSSPSVVSEISNATTISKASAQPSRQAPVFTTPQFNFTFDTTPSPMKYEMPFQQTESAQPTFRSNSIFFNPASGEGSGRRSSYFPPDFTQPSDIVYVEDASPADSGPNMSPPGQSPHGQVPGHHQLAPTNPTTQAPVPLMPAAHVPTPMPAHATLGGISTESLPHSQRAPPTPGFPPAHTPISSHHPQQLHHPVPQQASLMNQRPLPAPPVPGAGWFNTTSAFAPFPMNVAGDSFWGTGPHDAGFPVAHLGNDLAIPPERQGSLSIAQHSELMGLLENEGLADINTYLDVNLARGASGVGPNSWA